MLAPYFRANQPNSYLQLNLPGRGGQPAGEFTGKIARQTSLHDQSRPMRIRSVLNTRLTVKSLLHTPGEFPKGEVGERRGDIALRLKRIAASAYQHRKHVMEIGRFPVVLGR